MTLTTEQFKKLESKLGGIPLATEERREILRLLDEKIHAAETKMSAKLPKESKEAILKIAEIEAKVMQEEVAELITKRLKERVPAHIIGEVDIPKNYGELASKINKAADEIFEDVDKFHIHLSRNRIKNAIVKLEDITETGESAVMQSRLKDIEAIHPNIKALTSQIESFVMVNKHFSETYKQLEGRETMDFFIIAADLYRDFVQQKKMVDKRLRTSVLAFAPTLTEEKKIKEFYKTKEEEMMIQFDISESTVRGYYLDEDETGLTPKSVQSVNFEEVAKEVARDVFASVSFEEWKTLKRNNQKASNQRMDKTQQVSYRHANQLLESLKRAGMVDILTGKVDDTRLERKDAAKMLAQGATLEEAEEEQTKKEAEEERREKIFEDLALASQEKLGLLEKRVITYSPGRYSPHIEPVETRPPPDDLARARQKAYETGFDAARAAQESAWIDYQNDITLGLTGKKHLAKYKKATKRVETYQGLYQKEFGIHIEANPPIPTSPTESATLWKTPEEAIEFADMLARKGREVWSVFETTLGTYALAKRERYPNDTPIYTPVLKLGKPRDNIPRRGVRWYD